MPLPPLAAAPTISLEETLPWSAAARKMPPAATTTPSWADRQMWPTAATPPLLEETSTPTSAIFQPLAAVKQTRFRSMPIIRPSVEVEIMPSLDHSACRSYHPSPDD